jgi:hypothetical protein
MSRGRVLVQAISFFGTDVCLGPPRETAGSLFGCDLSDHIRKAAPPPRHCGANRHPYGAGLEPALL